VTDFNQNKSLRPPSKRKPLLTAKEEIGFGQAVNLIVRSLPPAVRKRLKPV
jgi:hypothetical protein